MKKLVFFLVLLSSCVQMPADYEAPTLLSPVNGSTHSKTIDFEWLPNNNADHTTKDYSFLFEISSDPEFNSIKDNFLVKIWNQYTTPIFTLKNGMNYWRVTATYTQNPNGHTTMLRSETWSINYIGNDGAVYVDPSTSNSENLGTKAYPIKTISEAFKIADMRNIKRINLANNSYSGLIPQYSAYTIKGCYDNITWIRDIYSCTMTVDDNDSIAYYGSASSLFYDMFN